MTGRGVFNEDSLREAIAGVWGEHGAHMDVFDQILRAARSQWTTEGPWNPASRSQGGSRVDRLKTAICDCANKDGGRHACDYYAEQVSATIEDDLDISEIEATAAKVLRHVGCRKYSRRWQSIVNAIAKELRADG